MKVKYPAICLCILALLASCSNTSRPPAREEQNIISAELGSADIRAVIQDSSDRLGYIDSEKQYKEFELSVNGKNINDGTLKIEERHDDYLILSHGGDLYMLDAANRRLSDLPKDNPEDTSLPMWMVSDSYIYRADMSGKLDIVSRVSGKVERTYPARNSSLRYLAWCSDDLAVGYEYDGSDSVQYIYFRDKDRFGFENPVPFRESERDNYGSKATVSVINAACYDAEYTSSLYPENNYTGPVFRSLYICRDNIHCGSVVFRIKENGDLRVLGESHGAGLQRFVDQAVPVLDYSLPDYQNRGIYENDLMFTVERNGMSAMVVPIKDKLMDMWVFSSVLISHSEIAFESDNVTFWAKGTSEFPPVHLTYDMDKFLLKGHEGDYIVYATQDDGRPFAIAMANFMDGSTEGFRMKCRLFEDMDRKSEVSLKDGKAYFSSSDAICSIPLDVLETADPEKVCDIPAGSRVIIPAL